MWDFLSLSGSYWDELFIKKSKCKGTGIEGVSLSITNRDDKATKRSMHVSSKEIIKLKKYLNHHFPSKESKDA